MYKILFLSALSLVILPDLQGQSYYFGFKGGPTLGFQNWGGYQRDPLLRYHGAFFMESYGGEEEKSSLYLQAGYHVRGSAIRFWNTFTTDAQGNPIEVPQHTRTFQFRNVALILGAKRVLGSTGNVRPYYTLGLRGEYTVGSNLPSLTDAPSGNNIFYAYYPVEEGLQRRRFNYGVSIGAGLELPFSELVGCFIEAGIHPDFSKQYYTPAFNTNYTNQFGSPISIPEQNIKNVSLEISVGFRFLRKVIYVD